MIQHGGQAKEDKKDMNLSQIENNETEQNLKII